MTRQSKSYNCNNSADDLGLSKFERQSAGAFHTPKNLAFAMAKKLYPEYIKCKTKQEIIEKFGNKGKKFIEEFNLIDPCCGTGNLLAAALNTYKWIEEEDLYGIDIDPRAIEFCMKKFPHGHFQVGNCLTDDFTSDEFWKTPSVGLFIYKKVKEIEKSKVKKKNVLQKEP